MKDLLFSGIFLSGTLLLSGQTSLDTAVNFSVVDIEGKQHKLYDYLNEGKFVLVEFFYTNCNPCIGGVPAINQAFEAYGCNQGEIFFLSIDYGNSDMEVEQYKETYGTKTPAVSGQEGGGNQVLFDYGIVAFPTVILIAPDRNIINPDIFPVTQSNLNFAISDQAGVDAFPEGCFFTATTDLRPVPTSSDLALNPNPVADRCSIGFSLSRQTSVELAVLNAAGGLVIAEPAIDLPAGHHLLERQFGLPAGAYWLCLIVDGRLEASRNFVQR